MNNYIELTNTDTNLPILIAIHGISAIIAYESGCEVVFFNEKIFVKENYKEIITKLNSQDLN